MRPLAKFLTIVVTFSSLIISPALAISPQDKILVDSISKKFSAVRSMAGKFVQFNPNGSKNNGIFYIQRPNLVLFSYQDAPLRMVSDSNNVFIHNEKLDSWTYHKISDTPLAIIASDKVDFMKSGVKEVHHEKDYVALLSPLKTLLGTSSIQLTFNKKNLTLKQWTVVDPRGQATSVVLYDIKYNIKIPKDIFAMPQLRK